MNRSTTPNCNAGTYGGLCNRKACREPGARWWNSSTRKFYCVMCASRINMECRRFGEEPICEYRETADA
jgi:hypothetical protein